MSDDLFGALFEQSVQKKKDKIAEKKQSEKEKRRAEKAKQREEARKKADQNQNTNNKKRKNNEEDLNTTNKKQKTGSGGSKKISVDQLRNDIRNILSGVPVVGDEDVDNLDDLNLDEIDVSDADEVDVGDDDREEFEVQDTPKKGKKNHEEVEEEPEAEYEDENAYTKEQKTLWMGNVSLEANKTKIIDFFKDCGKINDVRFLTQGQIRDSQVVFLEFKTMEAAKKGVKKNGQNFLGRKIKLRFAGDKNAPASNKNNNTGGKKGPVSSNSLFVKNLSFKTTELHLRQIFGECGDIATVRLPTFPDTGKPTGFGFVDFADPSGLSNALQMNRVDCLGRQLLLEAAAVKNKEDKFKKDNNGQTPTREAGSYNFGPKTASSPKPNIHHTFDNEEQDNKPKKKGKKQYEPKKR